MTGSDRSGSVVGGADTTTSSTDSTDGTDGTDGGARRSRRAAEAPLDAVPEQRQERESQARARNREALRTYRALADGHGAPEEAGTRVETPTRRQLRLQQVDGRAVPPAVGTARTPVPGGRRDRRRHAGSTADAPATAVDTPPVHGTPADRPSTDAGEGRRPEGMTVEEALSARNAIAAEAGEHVLTLQASGTDDPFTVDLEVLAQQKALAERAAVLNSRARRMQELSEQNRQPSAEPSDPTTAHNLSIIAPQEFVIAPGGSRAVLQAPSTSLVPVVLPRPAAVPADAPAAPAIGGDRIDAAAPQHPGAHETEPIRARSAFGLDPLDAMTAGLGRLRRVRYLQYSLLGVGAAALSTGIVLTVSSLNG
ncbi:hypothetical protein V6S67_06925 [Arthrobacter sp. Soc17.1.1.1]|uniref:hypothetical protein n=1 Tax=Arthrobacter sp. Soc17.1.1.1 TaxID=3121277 RepID=UPI002FE4A047